MIKEYTIEINENIEVKYGSINHKMPLVVYVHCKAWVCPQYQCEYDIVANEAFDKFKKSLKKTIYTSPYFEDRFVCDFDLNTDSMCVNKKNYLEFEFYVKQKDILMTLPQIKPTIEHSFKPLINALVQDFEDNTFILSKSKN